MHDPLTSTAIRRLGGLGIDMAPSPWCWSIVNLEPIGRIVLSAHARQGLARCPGDSGVRVVCRQVA